MLRQAEFTGKEFFLSDDRRKSITHYNSLEGRPRAEDFDRSLRAEIRDPLWMLCRQWQFGEFSGEDAGSAVKAKVQRHQGRINRFAIRNDDAMAYSDELPLETQVERETIPLDLRMRVQMARHWIRLTAGTRLDFYKEVYPLDMETSFELPDPGVAENILRMESDILAFQEYKGVSGRLFDGGKLFEAIMLARHIAHLDERVTDGRLTPSERDQLFNAEQPFLNWFRRIFSQPGTVDEDAWRPNYLEYQFACAAPSDKEGEGQSVLLAEEYFHGSLDWYAFNLDPDKRLEDGEGVEVPSAVFETPLPISFLPVPLEFGGMPNVRWWEFEDQKTDFGSVNADTTDLATLLIAEFGLMFGNDWSIVPLDLEVGSLCETLGVLVTDVFGIRTFVRAAGTGPDDDWQRWAMYNLSIAGSGGESDNRLFLPPVVAHIQESKPIEKVVLTHDEMANMVWAIEEIVPGILGYGNNGYELSTELVRYFMRHVIPQSNDLNITAAIQYKLGNTVPENWIPFIAQHIENSNRKIQLTRAAMQRLTDQLENTIILPRGTIISEGLDKEPRQGYFIHKEEVSRAGIQVTRSFQRARWFDGKTYVWLGKRKQTGRGQGSSGVEFDFIRDVKID